MEIVGLIISLISIPFSAYGALPIKIIQNCYERDTCKTIDGEKFRLAFIDTPEFQKFNENQIILIPIKYTTIFEDIKGKKIVRDETKVLFLNQSRDYSFLEINNSNYELNSLEKNFLINMQSFK